MTDEDIETIKKKTGGGKKESGFSLGGERNRVNTEYDKVRTNEE